MKTMFALAAAMFVLSGCAVYDSRGGYYDDGYKKPHPTAAHRARPRKAIAEIARSETRQKRVFLRSTARPA
jgi:hypothetical protein